MNKVTLYDGFFSLQTLSKNHQLCLVDLHFLWNGWIIIPKYLSFKTLVIYRFEQVIPMLFSDIVCSYSIH
jgi:hypothetical protein